MLSVEVEAEHSLSERPRQEMEKDGTDEQLEGQERMHLPKAAAAHLAHQVEDDRSDQPSNRVLRTFRGVGRQRADLEEKRAQQAHATLARAIKRAIDGAGDLAHQDLWRRALSSAEQLGHRVQRRERVHEAREQGRLAREEAIETRARHLGLRRQVVHREGVQAVGPDQLEGGVEDPLARAWLRLYVEGFEKRLPRFELTLEAPPRHACRRPPLTAPALPPAPHPPPR